MYIDFQTKDVVRFQSFRRNPFFAATLPVDRKTFSLPQSDEERSAQKDFYESGRDVGSVRLGQTPDSSIAGEYRCDS